MINVQRLTGWDFPPLQPIPGMCRVRIVSDNPLMKGWRTSKEQKFHHSVYVALLDDAVGELLSDFCSENCMVHPIITRSSSEIVRSVQR